MKREENSNTQNIEVEAQQIGTGSRGIEEKENAEKVPIPKEVTASTQKYNI